MVKEITVKLTPTMYYNIRHLIDNELTFSDLRIAERSSLSNAEKRLKKGFREYREAKKLKKVM